MAAGPNRARGLARRTSAPDAIHRARLPIAHRRQRVPLGREQRRIPNPDEQRRAFAAFRRAWSGNAVLDGVYIWNWYGFGGGGTVGYTPRGKPAEVEVRLLLNGL